MTTKVYTIDYSTNPVVDKLWTTVTLKFPFGSYLSGWQS